MLSNIHYLFQPIYILVMGLCIFVMFRNLHVCTHTHTSPDPVDMLQAIIYAQGLFHLNAWEMKNVNLLGLVSNSH